MILVTGGSGLLGNALIELLLAKGDTVKAIYNTTPLQFLSSPRFISVKCDILDVCELDDAMVGVNQVYHCAGMVSFLPKDEKNLYQINIEGTANVVNAALEAGVQKFVHVSSVAALGRIRPGEMINEKMQWTPETSNSRYGYTKYMGEMEVWRGVAEGLNAIIVNPVIILGPGDWNDGSTKIFKSIYEGFPWYSEGTTGFVDVRDAAEAMIQLMHSDISGERFIISAENASYHQVFDMIAKEFGKKLPSKKITPFLAALAWRLAAIKSIFTKTQPFITKETAATSLAAVQFDNSKLLKFLPQFRYRSLQQSITETCKLLKANK